MARLETRRRFWRIATAGIFFQGGAAAVDAVRLPMLTGCRLGEIMTLKWDYVDIKVRELRLPDSKTGAKIVHFGKTAADVLKSIKTPEDNPYVIAGKK